MDTIATSAASAYEKASTTTTFDPAAASGEVPKATSADTEALGLEERWYIVLHADEIHPVPVVVDALKELLGNHVYYADNPLTMAVKLLRQYGQMIVYGVNELAVDCGWTTIQLWRDGDRVAASKLGAAVLAKAAILQQHGLFCSILTRQELILEQRAISVLRWIRTVAQSCDPLCRCVAETILPQRHLAPLLRSDFCMSARITKAWYSLLLTLLAVPTFKSHLAAAYCDTYQVVTAKYAQGMGVLERSGYTLSVQFLNRVKYVVDLVQTRDLLGKLGKSLLETLSGASKNGRLDPNHYVLTYRRYSPCVSDLKCVLNVDRMPRVIAAAEGTFLDDWIAALKLTQFMDTQTWRHYGLGHVLEEARGWVGAFNASISLGGLYERLLGWADDDVSPITSGPLAGKLLSCVEFTLHVLMTGIATWQAGDEKNYIPTKYSASADPHSLAPASLPFSTVAAGFGTALAMRQLPVSQLSPFSFHLPLHRFATACIRELCLRGDLNGVHELMSVLCSSLTEQEHDDLFRGLMEYPMLVLTRAAQVRCGMWRRNGPGLNDQVLNYAEPPFCRNMRDADLFMTQFATLGRIRNQSRATSRPTDTGIAFLINLAVHRFGLFDFVCFKRAPTDNPSLYDDELKAQLYQPEVSDGDGLTNTLPWSYSPSSAGLSVLPFLEEFLHFVVVFVSELPANASRTKQEQTDQAKKRLHREVVHRLAAGPKQYSELSEVHHVLSHWDNFLLSEEGKKINPDDATGAALASVLEAVASKKVSRDKLQPDKWELSKESWETYDPAFLHCSLRNHQTAAEARPKPQPNESSPLGWEPRPYSPPLQSSHPSFSRLRRDATADSTLLSILYRVLHMHCSNVSISSAEEKIFGAETSDMLNSVAKSETTLSRALQLITLGAFAWSENLTVAHGWRSCGGGSPGSIFNDYSDSHGPNAVSWVQDFLLASPKDLLKDERYDGHETALVLILRLAKTGGAEGIFVAHDNCVRAGAAWLCEFSAGCNEEARNLIFPTDVSTFPEVPAGVNSDALLAKRKQLAKEKALARMQKQAAKFASLMDVDLVSDEDMSLTNSNGESCNTRPIAPQTPNTNRTSSFGSIASSGGSSTPCDGEDSEAQDLAKLNQVANEEVPPTRLLRSRPRCIICNGDDDVPTRETDEAGELHRKKSRRKTENALCLVGFVQPSCVHKGVGGHPMVATSGRSCTHGLVGTHVALCGHAVHSGCCESYLSSVLNREERSIGKRDEFRCPLCKRLSNCRKFACVVQG